MQEVKLCYNPFKLEIALSVKNENDWIPFNEESGLLRVSRMRMQRWLDPSLGYSYFDELLEALGDEEVTVYFSGTTEDMYDLQVAAESYCDTHRNVSIRILESSSAQKNSSAYKLAQLRNILDDVQKWDFKSLLPKETLTYLHDCLSPRSVSATLMPLHEIPENSDIIFGEGAWQMICLILYYQDMHSGQNRKLLKAFAQQLERLKDRNFERERFLFLCAYRNQSPPSDDSIRRLFMEYGLGDMNVIALEEQALEQLNELDAGIECENFVAAQRCVMMYENRYAEQYRLRKMHDVLGKTMSAQGYTTNSNLTRRIDKALRGGGTSKRRISDATVLKAVEWIRDFSSRIECLIEIDE